MRPEISIVAWLNECPHVYVTDWRLIELILDKLLDLGVQLIDQRGRLDLVCWSDTNSVNISLKAVFEARSLKDVKSLSERLDSSAESEMRANFLDDGLNLKIIRLLLEQHGGELEIDDADDRIEFEICLPLDESTSGKNGPLLRKPVHTNPETPQGEPT